MTVTLCVDEKCEIRILTPDDSEPFAVLDFPDATIHLPYVGRKQADVLRDLGIKLIEASGKLSAMQPARVTAAVVAEPELLNI
jgi:hypothetical protein